jgi:hypothetical protein
VRNEYEHKRRSRAAKKGWHTRKRKAVPSPAQQELLQSLVKPGWMIQQRLGAYYGQYFYLCAPPPSIRRNRVNFRTFAILLARCWIDCAGQKKDGQFTITVPHRGRVTNDILLRDWVISDKGRQALARVGVN